MYKNISMFFTKTLCTWLFVACSYAVVECRSYNNGLIFYNLENHNTYLPPTISVSRGRGLAKFKYSPRGSIWSTFGRPCNCEGHLCGCCVGIKVKQYNFDQKMCANVSYVRPKQEIQLEVFLNDTATAKYGIDARNPSPLCVPIMMGIPMSMCIQMSNIGVQGDNLNMCMDFLVRLASTELFEMHFQCMKVGLQGASWVGSDGQPVIPANEGKLKDKITNQSEEYYDESAAEEENDIDSKEEEDEKTTANSEEESDLNKAEEEMDYNDITEQIKDIVKEEEENNVVKEPQRHAVSPLQDNKQVEEIVTNIMESINQGNAAEEMNGIMEKPIDVDAHKNHMMGNQETIALGNTDANEENELSLAAASSIVENIEQAIEYSALNVIKNITKEEIKDSSENQEYDLEHNLESLKEDANIEDSIKDENEAVENSKNSEDLPNNIVKDEVHLEESFESSQDKDMQIESNIDYSQETSTESNDLPMKAADEQDSESSEKAEVLMTEITTEHIFDDQDYDAMEKLENVSNSSDVADINKDDSEPHSSLDMQQQVMDTSTKHSMASNIKPIKQQDTATASELGNNASADNTLTTAAIMTTATIGKTTTTNKPTISDDSVVTETETFIINTDGLDKSDNSDYDDDDQDGDNENSEADGDNSHENDSDYEDEESEETDDDRNENVIKSNNGTTIVMPNITALNNKNGVKHTESAGVQQLAEESHSNESNSNEESSDITKDEFEAEEGEFEDAADEKDHKESNEQYGADTEDEDEFEDYETTTTTKTLNISDNNTCCKPVISFASNNSHVSNIIQKLDDSNNTAKIPQIKTASSNNLQFVSNSNAMISNTDDVNMLNVGSTANKMSQIIVGSAATATGGTATATVKTVTSSNVIPLSLARKLYSPQHHQQQHYRRSRQHQYYV